MGRRVLFTLAFPVLSYLALIALVLGVGWLAVSWLATGTPGTRQLGRGLRSRDSLRFPGGFLHGSGGHGPQRSGRRVHRQQPKENRRSWGRSGRMRARVNC